jgi:putative inorganic carbon (HCO3(-)) transporter
VLAIGTAYGVGSYRASARTEEPEVGRWEPIERSLPAAPRLRELPAPTPLRVADFDPPARRSPHAAPPRWESPSFRMDPLMPADPFPPTDYPETEARRPTLHPPVSRPPSPPRRPLQRAGIALLCLVALALALAIGVVGAQHTTSLVTAHEKLFPLAVLGVAGIALLVAVVTSVDPSWLLTAGLVLSVFSGDWHYMHIPVPLDRLVIFVAVAVVVMRPLFDANAPRLRPRRIHALLAIFSLYAISSAILDGTVLTHVALFDLLDRLGVEPFLLYLIAPAVFATEAQRRRLLVALVLIGVYLGITAILEFVAHSLVFPSFIENPALGIHYGRARGPFLEAGADGLAMFTSAVACVMLFGQRPPVRVRAVLWSTIVLCVIGILLTLTRQVWIGALLGSLFAAGLSPRLRRLAPFGLLATALLIGLLLTVVPGLEHRVNARTTDQMPLWDRYNSDAAALRMIESKPLAGVGWGEFALKSDRYYHVAAHYPLTSVGEVHNVVLSNAAELGVIGVVLWFGAIAIAFIGPLRRRGPPALEPWKLAMVAVGVAWFVQLNFAPVSYAFDNYIPWIFAALAAGHAPAAMQITRRQDVRREAVAA